MRFSLSNNSFADSDERIIKELSSIKANRDGEMINYYFTNYNLEITIPKKHIPLADFNELGVRLFTCDWDYCNPNTDPIFCNQDWAKKFKNINMEYHSIPLSINEIIEVMKYLRRLEKIAAFND